jgi:hypothetical protein
VTDRGERIAAARAAAFGALSAAAGGDSLCTLSRERLPAAKYHEGAVAALGEALRAERLGSAAPDAAAWGSSYARHADRDPHWRAYLVGGRDALAKLARELAVDRGVPAGG